MYTATPPRIETGLALTSERETAESSTCPCFHVGSTRKPIPTFSPPTSIARHVRAHRGLCGYRRQPVL